MHARILPPLALILLILLTSLTQNLSGKSAEEGNTFSLADSSLNQLNNWQKQDSLLPWMAYLKSKSQELRGKNEIANSISVLSKCIDEIWRDPTNLDEATTMGWVYVNRAYLYDQKYGDFLAAKNDYLSGLRCFESFNYSNYLVARHLLQPLGNIYTRLGENEQAIDMLSQFQQICQKENQTEALMNSYNDLGRAFMNNDDYSRAIKLFEVGIEIAPNDFTNSGLILSSKAEAELYSEKFEDGISTGKLALQHLTKALKKSTPSDFRYEATGRYITGVHTILGRLYLQKSEFDLSFFHFQRAWEKTLLFYKGKHRRKSKILNGLGDCYKQSNLLVESITSYQKALAESIIGFDDDSIFSNPPDNLLFADVAIGESLIGKARVAQSLFNESANEQWLQLAVDTYLTYFRWVKRLRAEQLNIESKLNLTSEIHKIGEETLYAIFLLKTQTKDASLAETAFEIMEQTKGMVLSEALISTLLDTDNSLLNEALVELDQLKMQKSLFTISLSNANLTEKKRIEARITELNKKIQIKDFQLKENYSSYNKLRTNQNDSIDFEKLRIYLSEKESNLTSYFLGEHNLFAVTATPTNIEFNKVDTKDYEKIVTDFLFELNHPNQSNPEEYEKLGHQLFKILFQQKEIPTNLLLLPDGELNLIPFEALVKKESNAAPSFKKMDYVLLSHAIHYAPSLKFVLQDWNNAPSKKTYLGMAPIFKKSDEFQYLPHSENEVTYANELFEGDVFINAKAAKSEFIKRAANYEIIHLSTHAGYGTGKNNDGWIAFSSNEKLLTPELLQLNLSAKLVVLNGCETGLGEIYKGEGILSMARGFMQAGTQNTITNLWQVNHSSNAKLMHTFYETLQTGASLSSSLQKAKISYINNQEIDDASAHPFYWSASILIGTNNAVTIQKKSNPTSLFVLITAGIVSILLLVLFFFYQKKKG